MYTLIIKLLALALCGMTLAACKIQIEVPQGGSVISTSGNYECAAASSCIVDVSSVSFDETFAAVPEPGFSFAGWRRRPDLGLCGGSLDPCHLITASFAGNAALMALLEDDFQVYLEPVFVKFSTAGVFCDYDDVTYNSQPSLTFTSVSQWTCSTATRDLSANGIPDHEVGTFPNPGNPNTIGEQNVAASYVLQPELGTTATTLGGPQGPIGYVLNGVKIDAGTAGTCDDSGNSCSLAGNVGQWSIEALGQESFDFGDDDNHAHVQPGGAYHYHGIPEGFVAKRGGNDATMTLIGWAADGFPIYARYGYAIADDANSGIRQISGSYQLVSQVSASRPSSNVYPLGTFSQDWEYVAGSGDLDECNGRFGVTPEFPAGIYHYYATDSYPYFQRCVKGLVETSGSFPPF